MLIRFIPSNSRAAGLTRRFVGGLVHAGSGFWCSARPEMSFGMRVVRYVPLYLTFAEQKALRL